MLNFFFVIISAQKNILEEPNDQYFNYTAVYDDTFYGISKMFNITLNELYEINKINSSFKIYIGMQVLIPGINPYPDSSITGPTGTDVIFLAVRISFFAKPRPGFLQILNLPAICFVTSPALEIDFIRIGHIAFFVNCNFVGLNFSAGILARDSVSKVF